MQDSSQYPGPIHQQSFAGASKRKNPLGFLLASLLVLLAVGGTGVGVYYWQQQQIDKLTAANNDLTTKVQQPSGNTEKMPTTKEYTNTKFGYRFVFSADTPIYAGGPQGADALTVSSESAHVYLGQQSSFSVMDTVLKALTEAEVKKQFANADTNFKVQNVKFAGRDALMLPANTINNPSVFYWVQADAESPILQVAALPASDDVVKSFSFLK